MPSESSAASLSFEAADKAASVAHDFIHGLNGVTKAQADAAIWTIHEVLRPLIPLSSLPGYDEVVAELNRLNYEADRG